MDWAAKQSEKIEHDEQELVEQRCAHVNISQGGGKPLRWGEETLFVNASIMNVNYRPVNAPWLIDLDLPMAETAGSKTFQFPK